MKRFYKAGLITTLLIMLVALVAAVPALAVEPREGTPSEISQPFLDLSEEGDDVARIKFGHSLLYAGNNAVNSASTDGLLLSFGNRMEVQGVGEYSIAAANILEIHGVTEKDLFAAGNLIRVAKDAEIGRDVYLAGNDISIESNLSGNLAIAASKVTFTDVTINGDVNLNVAQIVFGQNVSILGSLVYNEDAIVSGLDDVSVAHVQTYAPIKTESSAGELWASQAIEAIGTFIIALILIIAFPRLKDRVATESSAQRLGANFLNGLGFLVLVPVLSILLMISVFGMKAGLVLLAVWFLVVCLTGVFTGMWLGHLIVEKLLRSRAPFVVETAIGIIVLGCLMLIPGVDALATLFSVVFGTGLMISYVRPPKLKEVEADEPAKPLENPFRGQSKKSATKSSTKKPAVKSSPAKVKKPGNVKATKPTRKPSQKK